MSFDTSPRGFSAPASGDLSAKQYRFVTIDSNGRIAVSGAGVIWAGILQDAPAALGRAGNVATTGVTKVVIGGSVTAGNHVVPDANGAGVSGGSGDIRGLVALESGASGDIIACALT